MTDPPPTRLWLTEEGFLCGEVREGIDMTIELARETTAGVAALSGGIRRALLVDISNVRSITREARNHFAVDSRDLCTCVALVVASPIGRAIGNFYLAVNKPVLPTRLFTTREDALAWMREQARLDRVA